MKRRTTIVISIICFITSSSFMFLDFSKSNRSLLEQIFSINIFEPIKASSGKYVYTYQDDTGKVTIRTDKIIYHTRHIPEEHLNFNTQKANTIKENGPCDVLKEPISGAMKDYGINVIETRLVWWELEGKKGIYNYDRLKRDMDLIEKNGFKVGVFPWFQHPPEWATYFVKARCLEHNTESCIPSLWDKNLLKEYDILYKDLSVKFGERIDFLYVGIYGDYGEVMYPSGVKHYRFSSPHGHSGFWCGDSLARLDFKDFLIEKYKSINKLNKTWGIEFSTFDADLMPKLPLTDNSLHQRLDFMNWYTGSLMSFTDDVCKIARKYFPDTELGMPLGAVYEKLATGQIKSIAVKIAAKYNMVARWTGWAHLGEFALSNVCTRRISSPTRFYGCKFGVETASRFSRDNTLNAIYETLANSTSVLHNDPRNISNEEDLYKKYGNRVITLPVNCNISVYYPVEAEMCKCINISSVYQEFKELRGHCDYEITDSYMIKDGFLETTEKLVLPNNCLIPRETAKIIEKWAKRGGEVYYINGNGPGILENIQPFKIGSGIESWNFFGKNDGCYYTDHVDKISKYDPVNKTIEILNK